MKNERPVIAKVKNLLNEKFDGEIQMFDCRNVVGDPMETIFREDGVTVDYCYAYNYIEIFGLTNDEFNELNDEFGVDKKWKKIFEEALLKIEEEYEVFYNNAN